MALNASGTGYRFVYFNFRSTGHCVFYTATSKLYGTEQALKVILEMRDADADSHEFSNQLIQKQIHVKVRLFNLMLFEQDKDFPRVIAGPIPQRQRE